MSNADCQVKCGADLRNENGESEVGDRGFDSKGYAWLASAQARRDLQQADKLPKTLGERIEEGDRLMQLAWDKRQPKKYYWIIETPCRSGRTVAFKEHITPQVFEAGPKKRCRKDLHQLAKPGPCPKCATKRNRRHQAEFRSKRLATKSQPNYAPLP